MSFGHERKHKRVEFRDLPWVFTLQTARPLSSDRPIRLEAKNISLGGMKFVSNQKVSLFEEVQIILFHRENGSILTPLKGKVVRLEEVDTGVGEKVFGIAVEFLSDAKALESELRS